MCKLWNLSNVGIEGTVTLCILSRSEREETSVTSAASHSRQERMERNISSPPAPHHPTYPGNTLSSLSPSQGAGNGEGGKPANTLTVYTANGDLHTSIVQYAQHQKTRPCISSAPANSPTGARPRCLSHLEIRRQINERLTTLTSRSGASPSPPSSRPMLYRAGGGLEGVLLCEYLGKGETWGTDIKVY